MSKVQQSKTEGAQVLRECRLPRCKVKFKVPSSAPHKAFCCAEHRMEWHKVEVQQALARLRTEGEEG